MNKSVLRPWLELARISNLPTVWTNILAAWLLAGGKWEWKPLAWLLAGGSLIYTGGMFLNDAADVKFDRDHRRERPIPSGRIPLAQAWIAGIGFLLGGSAMFVWGAETCVWLTASLIAAIMVYDLYHKPWTGSVFIMGSCRTLLYLAAASAVSGTLNWSDSHEIIFKSIALGGFVVGLSLVARHESARHRSATGGAHPGSLILGGFGLVSPLIAGIWYAGWHHQWQPLLFALALAAWIHVALRWMRENPAWIGESVGLLLAAITTVDALAVATASLPAALCFFTLTPFLLFSQKKIAAT